MLTSVEENDCSSDTIMFGDNSEGKVLVYGKSDMFFKRGQSLLNLLLKFMKVSCLAMTQTLAHIVFSTKTPVVLKPHLTWYLMRLMAPKCRNMILIL
jgi:hypothetical protein